MPTEQVACYWGGALAEEGDPNREGLRLLCAKPLLSAGKYDMFATK